MNLLRKASLALLAYVMLLSVLGIASPASAADSNQVTIEVTTRETSLIPGNSVMVSVRISKITPENPNLRSALIALSYDEKAFSTEGNIRFDDMLGKYIWRADTFIIPSKTYESSDYLIEAPYPVDLDPADGRREVIVSISALNNWTISSANDEAFISFYLSVNKEAPTQESSINVLAEETVLTDAAGNSIKAFGTTSAQVHVGFPKQIEIVRGTLPPTSDPFKVSLSSGTELNALAIFENGDTSYITGIASWDTTDHQVITAPVYGNIQAIGLGKAEVTVTFGNMTGKHEVLVYPKGAPELIEKEVAYVTRIPNERMFAKAAIVQIKVNGKAAEPGRIFDGTTYVPLRSVSNLLGMEIEYDNVKKAPTLNGKAVPHFFTFSGTTYIWARDLPALLGAKMSWDRNKTTLIIETSVQK
ncbi:MULTISPECIES: copper amine oxidase N-terminal domain-containing protein [Paenibacillus]|uniref:copper amine oxidase N-terminal domain-containing protein n=1 Tax=Paenibacillus TaxID=44249 RepID=UPI00073F0BB5|nr:MULTISPECIES: copper amine oxidase N-terminal domain-containing protein [Paenibacillus]MDU4698718.1 copper amine oxidase N-terminal domain-containing protein [Paenibacillus sp.]